MRMRMSLKTLAIATSTVACAALPSFGWSPQGGVSLSVEKAQAYTRVVVRPNPYSVGPNNRGGLVGGGSVGIGPGIVGGGLPWYAVRAYYAGGPWCAAGAYGYGPGLNNYSCYSGWADYKAKNGIVCDPGTVIKGGDGILYMCQ
jgi:hypothetical protein